MVLQYVITTRLGKAKIQLRIQLELRVSLIYERGM